MKCIHNSKCDHIIQSDDCCHIRRFLQQFFRQLIPDLVLRINMRHIQINFFFCRFYAHLVTQSDFLIFFQEALYPLRTLLLPCRKRRCYICNFPVSQFQQMFRHDSSKLGIVKFHRIYIHLFILVIDDRNRYLFCNFSHKFHKAMARITGIDNSKRS